MFLLQSTGYTILHGFQDMCILCWECHNDESCGENWHCLCHDFTKTSEVMLHQNNAFPCFCHLNSADYTWIKRWYKTSVPSKHITSVSLRWHPYRCLGKSKYTDSTKPLLQWRTANEGNMNYHITSGNSRWHICTDVWVKANPLIRRSHYCSGELLMRAM